MLENSADSVHIKDAGNDKGNGSGNNEHEALINKVAQETANIKTSSLMGFEKAPDNQLSRYGLAALKGIAEIPQGVVNAVKHDIEHPVETLGALGMGAATAVVLKTVLPEGGIVGKVAGAALGTYFAVESARPFIAGLKQAGAAKTMNDLDMAARQIGDAGGNYLVSSAVGAVGYRIGGAIADGLLSTNTLAPFRQAKSNFYDRLDTNIVRFKDAAVESLKARFDPDTLTTEQRLEAISNSKIHSVIPPYLLEELSRRDPHNFDLLNTYKASLQLQAEMQNRPHPFGPRTGDDFHGAREVYDAQGKEELPGLRVRFEGEGPAGNSDADKAYDFTGSVRDFYLKEYGRNSIDDSGMKFISTVQYGKNFGNAFWNGEQMVYGHPGEDSPFKTLMILDVCGHEITHGVTEKEANFKYYGQSGALNESISDVYGSLIKQYVKHQTAAAADWLIGEGCWKDNIDGKALRDMLHPGTAYADKHIGIDPQPADMSHYIKTVKDQGGVHLNSGIPNKAFAAFAQAVGGYAWDDPGHIWFEARKESGNNPSFAQFAYHTIEAAKELGKSELIPKLERAWDAVGVIPDENQTDVITPHPAKAKVLGFLFPWRKAGSDAATNTAG